jgi:RNA polymerase sigma-70 factor (ECF subfamily)
MSALVWQKGNGSSISPAVQSEMLSLIPNLRAYALSLCANADQADDLVQETLLRALSHIDSFQPGTNLASWLVTILRNCFLSELRKRRKEVADTDGLYVERLRSPPEQESRMEFKELWTALAQLPLAQREALLLVGTADFSYEDTATICQTTTGTIKSRVNRARTRLAELLSIENVSELGCNSGIRGVLR